MNDTNVVDAATKRLQQALDALDSALERRLEVDRDRGVLSDHIHSLGVDRSRLASDLDQAIARSRQLEAVNREVTQRLDAAMARIQSIIAAPETAADAEEAEQADETEDAEDSDQAEDADGADEADESEDADETDETEDAAQTEKLDR